MLIILNHDNGRILHLIIMFLPAVWSGFACLSNPCINGVCLDDLNSSYFCYCINGYTGVECQTNWNECWSSPCQNGGACIDGIATFSCTCLPGYSGELCQQDIDECESNPCVNNATCTDATNGYICHCPLGYSGVHCEVDIAVCNTSNVNRCYNGGICIEGPGDSFSCECQHGWGGAVCNEELDECLSSPCQNGAICIDFHNGYSCACLFGYTGRHCEEVIQICDDNPCRNSALCLVEDDHFTCYCVPDFHGVRCEFQYNECLLGSRCMNGGTCIDGIDNFTCSCPSPYTGVLCESVMSINETTDWDSVSTLPTVLTTIFKDQYSSTYSTTYSTVGLDEKEEITTKEVTDNVFESSTKALSDFYTSSQVQNMTISQSRTEIYSPITLPATTTTYEQKLSTTTAEIYTQGTELMRSLESSSQIILPYSEQYSSPESSTVLYRAYSSDITPMPLSSTRETTSIGSLYSTELSVTYSIENTELTDNEIIRSDIDEKTVPFSTISPFFTEAPDKRLSSYITSFPETQRPTEEMMPDCSQMESPCRNGGTCVFRNNTYQCHCPSDTDGRFCEIDLTTTNIAFEGTSYISYILYNYSRVSVEFKAKTMANQGLLFYWFVDMTYMKLYIDGGSLKFKFSCGYQTMLLSELGSPVNDGSIFRVKIWLTLKNDFSHCYAGVQVNDTLEMTGDQVAKIKILVKPMIEIYLGGLPSHLRSTVDGFLGCLSDLRINNQVINIYRDADVIQNIKECTSLPCLSSPCGNGGSCSSEGNIWRCHCRNGFTGKTCSESVCKDNPCLFGGSCEVFGYGYVCLCPYGKHGHFCEDDLRISEPFFSSAVNGLSSYAAYRFPDGITTNMELKFRITPTTMDQISLLLFLGQAGQHNFYSDHLAVSFVKGYIMLTWNLGSGPRRIFTNRPIKEGVKDCLIKVGHVGRRAWLYVENLGNITGRSPGNLIKLNVESILYVGGHESRNFSILPHDLPLHNGFSGCIFDIEMKSGSAIVSFERSSGTVGRAVGQCGTSECYEHSCQNSGACIHHGSTFMCMCQDNWYGPLCSSNMNLCDANIMNCSEGATCVPTLGGYECDCPLGLVGKHCEIRLNLTDISFTGKRSFVELNPININFTQFHMELQLRALQDNGVIIFIRTDNGFIVSLVLIHSILELRLQTGYEIPPRQLVIIGGSKLITKAIWYNVKFGLFGKRCYLSIDNMISTGIFDHHNHFSSYDQTIFIGGLPDLSEFPVAASSILPISFKGCLRKVSINDKFLPLVSQNIRQSRNLIDCDGTPCGQELCQNGGTCWLDSLMKPHCACNLPFFGEACELIKDCTEGNCGVKGECQDAKCSCQFGWSGIMCEKQVTVPKFSGQSYLAVKTLVDKKRALHVRPNKSIFLNITTVHQDGILLWSTDKDGSFFGMGLEHGHLKTAHHNCVEIYPALHLADGLWHSIKLTILPYSVSIDDKKLNDGSLCEPKNITVGEEIYIGGIPNNNELIQATHSLFGNGFKGCIGSFQNNPEDIYNFDISEGKDIDLCESL